MLPSVQVQTLYQQAPGLGRGEVFLSIEPTCPAQGPMVLLSLFTLMAVPAIPVTVGCCGRCRLSISVGCIAPLQGKGEGETAQGLSGADTSSNLCRGPESPGRRRPART